MPDPTPTPEKEKPSSQGYVKDKPSNENQDKQLKDLGIGKDGGTREKNEK